MDESVHCGGLIARCCRQGRPPQVVVFTPGLVAPLEHAIRAAMTHLGLPEDRLFLAEQSAGLPDRGPAFEAIVREVGLVMWRHDCTIICAPGAESRLTRHRAAFRIAAEVAARSGVGLISYGASERLEPAALREILRLDVTPDLGRKGRAMEAYGLPAERNAPPATEVFQRHR